MDASAAQPPQPHPNSGSSSAGGGGVTLDACREQFYVAQRANERLAAQLKAFVGGLEQQKPDDGWLEQVREEAGRLVRFHETQLQQWQQISGGIEAYVDEVRQLAETMAINELKGLLTQEAELPENKAKTVHPELAKFQLEKKARILGKIGGVPALGPGMVALPKPQPGQVLKATASPAAREIYYSKVEDKDAANLAGVFQFRRTAEDDTPVAWQQESGAKNARKGSEAAAAELRRQEEQEQQLSAGGAVGAELAGALRARQKVLKTTEESEAAAATSRYRRTQQLPSGADPDGDLQAATPELAEKLKRRQEEEERALRLKQQAEEEAGDAGVDAQPGWSNSTAPFGSELASVLLKRRQTKEAADAAEPVKATDAAASRDNTAPAETSELAKLLAQRQAKLASQ